MVLTITILFLVLTTILLCFIFFDFPYRIVLFFFAPKAKVKAICHPWKCKIIWYIKGGFQPSGNIMAHERKHLEQIEEYGSWKFVFKYLLYTIRYGYKNNPFEIEARNEEKFI